MTFTRQQVLKKISLHDGKQQKLIETKRGTTKSEIKSFQEGIAEEKIQPIPQTTTKKRIKSQPMRKKDVRNCTLKRRTATKAEETLRVIREEIHYIRVGFTVPDVNSGPTKILV